MIFLGDTWPGAIWPCLSGGEEKFRDRVVCVNLETGLLPEDAPRRELFKCRRGDLARVAREYAAACIANNHVNDGGRLTELRQVCGEAGLPVFGAGRNLSEALKPVRLRDHDGTEVILLGFGWPVIGCVPASARRAGTAHLERSLVLETLRSVRAKYSKARIVLWMHWGYELDVACQPVHRALALECLRGGADAVIGAHSHNVQAVELIDGKVLAHSLGNWIMPHGSVGGSPTLSYPKDCLRQMALEIEFGEGRVICHRYHFNPSEGKITYAGSAPPEKPEWGEASLHADAAEAFQAWYDLRRRRSPGLPVFRVDEASSLRTAKEVWIGARHLAARVVRRLQGRLYDRSR